MITAKTPPPANTQTDPAAQGSELLLGLLSRREGLLFCFLILLNLLPLWLFEYFPTHDGPAHLHTAKVLSGYFNPAFPVFKKYYVLDLGLFPNWIIYVLLANLMKLVPVLMAERIMLTVYAVLFAFAIRFILRVINPGSLFLSCLAVPFIFNRFLHAGYYNFSYSLPFYFLVLGYWMKHQGRLGFRQLMIFALLSGLLYFSHLVSFVTAGIGLGVLIVWTSLWEAHGRGKPYDAPGFFKTVFGRALPLIFACSPFLVLALIYVKREGIATFPTRPEENLILNVLTLNPLVSYAASEVAVAGAIAFVIFGMSLYWVTVKIKTRQAGLWDGLFLLALVYGIIYFFGPDGMAGGRYIAARINLYFFLTLILWCAAQTYSLPAKRLITGFSIAACLIFLGLHTWKYAELNTYLKDYLSGMPLIRMNATLLPIVFHDGRDSTGRLLSLNLNPFLHASGYISSQKQAVDFGNYQAVAPSFPVRFRSEFNPNAHMRQKTSSESASFQAPRLDFAAYPDRTGGELDYVLLWGLPDGAGRDEFAKSVLSQLEEGYDLVFVSPQYRLMRLYKRKGAA